jgi:hypothetical protein
MTTLNENEYSVSMEIRAPDKPGTFVLQINVVEEGIQWFTDNGLLSLDCVPIPIDRDITGLLKTRFKEALFKRSPVLFYKLRALKLSHNSENPFKNLKNYGKGKRCFIIGNGPSLNKIDITLLKDEVTFGVNSIFLLYDKMGFEPTYYLVEDNLVMEDRHEDIDKYVVKSTKFFPKVYSRFIKNRKNTHFVDFFTVFDYRGFPHFSKDPMVYCWHGGTVSYFCMQIAFYFGFSEVYLVGFDHNYTIPSSAQIEGYCITSTEDDVNHFSPDYFGKGYRWHDPMMDRMETSYNKAKKVFERNGRKIYNATKGGKLEVFPRVEFESLFEKEDMSGKHL